MFNCLFSLRILAMNYRLPTLPVLAACLALVSPLPAAAPLPSERSTLLYSVTHLVAARQPGKALAAAQQLLARDRAALAEAGKASDPARLARCQQRLVEALSNLAELNSYLNRFADAETAYREAVQVCLKLHGEEHPETATCLHGLGKIYRIAGQPARALPLLQQALRIREKTLGDDHLAVADTLNMIALAQLDAGHRLTFLPLLERCLKIREKRLPPNHPDLAITLNNLAVAHMSSGVWNRQAKAYDLLQRGLKILEANHGSEHPDVGVQLVNLAAVSAQIDGKRDQAEGLYRRALKVLQKVHGPDNANVAQCMGMLGDLLMSQNKLAQAEPLYRQALAIREKVLPPTHPRLIASLEDLIHVQAARQRWDDVAGYLDRTSRLMRLHVRTNLPAMTTPEQLAFLQRTQEPALHRALTLPFLRRDDRALVQRSAEWALNGKAVAHQSQAEQIALARSGQAAGSEAAIRQLLAVRAELALLAAEGGGPDDDKRKERLARLEEQQRRLASQLGLGQRSLQLDRNDLWVTLDAVRARIPSDGVLVEIVDHDLWDFKKNNWKAVPWDEEARKKLGEMERAQSRYVAWVIPPRGKGDVRYVDLGDRWEIGALIKAYQDAMKAALRKIAIDEEDAEAELLKSLKALAERVLAPLEKHLAGARKWIISPDSDLWLVPWAALPLRDGRYAVEKHQISHVVTGRDLVRAASSVKPAAALVLGDPDFDLGSTEVQKRAGLLVAKGAPVLRGALPASLARVPRDWARLFGTADEIRAVAPRLKKYTGSAPRVYSGKEAVESVVKAARSPRVLVLSTHGFVLPPPPAPAAMKDVGDSIPPRKIRMYVSSLAAIEYTGDALQRCGIVLAGANKRDQKAPPTADDGILTGIEVLGCDLAGTELVVLSACETGLGQVNVGEGVSGLRQAFLLAGARSVVASLWKVSDLESVKLMTLFWDNLAAGQGKAEALRSAQLTFIKERRQKEKAAHPFFWAAFSLTGDL
jgi:CHAT domain-containing protein